MIKLSYTGDKNLQQIFMEQKVVIHDSVMESIGKIWRNPAIKEVEVVNIEINEINYTIVIEKSNFLKGLLGALNTFEEHELYEKCQECLNLINQIKQV